MTVTENARKLSGVLRREGWNGVAQRLARRATKRWGGDSEPIFLRATDVVDSSMVGIPPARPARASGESLRIGWVLTAPGPASGGHTTIFRFVEAVEAAGHRCILYVYDGQGGAARQYEELIRTWWPRVRAEVRDVSELGAPGEDIDAFVATAWPTAHILAGRDNIPGARFYLVQDFEPYFYPRGSAYELAEDTYRFGFTPLTVGRMVADELHSRFDDQPIVAEFGCDRERYSVLDHTPRDAVIFYAKPGTARRGYELGLMALQLFHQANPAVEIHTFGVTARRLPFPATVHGHMSPVELNRLYNRCGAGLALSFTNISLIAFELLAAGVTPVVNDSAGTRADLSNPHVAWTRPTPRAVAEALEIALASHRIAGPDALAASVAEVSWAPAQATVLHAIEEACTRPRTKSPHTAGGRL
ncbi:rhamnosyltransferase WsaF family glycosyltransferase [Cryobacterium sp. AP23]